MSEEKPQNRRRSSDEAIESLRRDIRDSRAESMAAIDSVRQEVVGNRIEAKLERKQIRDQVNCIVKGVEDFNEKYKPYLDRQLEVEKDRRDFVREKYRSLRSWAVNVAAIFLGLIVLYGVTAADFWRRIIDKAKSLI